MSALREYYEKKYGAAKAPAAAQVEAFGSGKTAGAAFMDELQKLNETTAGQVRKTQEAKS